MNLNINPYDSSVIDPLEKSLISIYLSRSEKDMDHLIKHTLPELCTVDSIEFIDKKSKATYSHSFNYKDKKYYINFYKKSGSVDKLFLKKVGQALITTLIQIEKARELKTHQKQWELAFNTITIPICLTDLKGYILKTNESFRKTLNQVEINLLKKHYFNVFFGRKKTTLEKVTSKKITMQETILINNQESTFEVSIQKVTIDLEEAVQLVAIRDITEQKKMEYQIAQSAKSAELGIISSSIAHELNNPIAGVQMLLQSMLLQNTLLESQKKDIKEMLIAIERCTNIIDQLLKAHHH